MTTVSATRTENETKGRERETCPCVQCIGDTRHVVRVSVDSTEPLGPEVHGFQQFQIVECLGCKAPSFRRETSRDDDGFVDEGGETDLWITEELYPPRKGNRKPLPHAAKLPPRIAHLYSEVHRALQDEFPVLAGIGIRAIIEAVCKHKHERGGTLEKKINSLVERSK
jgi:hypothetical protein